MIVSSPVRRCGNTALQKANVAESRKRYGRWLRVSLSIYGASITVAISGSGDTMSYIVATVLLWIFLP
jgi:hypothetical protein